MWLVVTGVFLASTPAKACYSVVVGKHATQDGAVIIAHNEDDWGPQLVNHHKVPRMRHAPGSTVTLRNGGTVEQVDQTWAYIWSELPGMRFSDSFVNEWGVTVTSDNCPSREDKPDLTDGGIGAMLRRLIAQRATSARHAVLLAGELVERFGYVDSGRTYVIGDPNEGWLFCAVNGKHWLAQRVPDDHVAMVANTYSVREVSLDDEDHVLACEDIVAYARSRGWYDPQKDGAFDFAAAYASPQAASHPSNIGRQWSGLCYVTRKSIEPGPDLPFSVPPRHRLSVTDVMRILRHDKSDGTPARVDSPFVCSLCQGETRTSFVAQLRPIQPLDIGVVYWVTLAPPRTSFYIPFHLGSAQFPAGFCLESVRPSAEAFDAKVEAPFAVHPFEPFWMFTNLRQKVVDDAVAMKTLRHQAEGIERQAVAMQPSIEQAARVLYRTDRGAATQLLENYSKGIYLSCLEAVRTIALQD
jgi:dipeptidase